MRDDHSQVYTLETRFGAENSQSDVNTAKDCNFDPYVRQAS